MDRRRFLQIIGAAGVAAAIPWRFDLKNGLHWAQAQAFAESPALPLWATTLRGVGPDGIPVAAADSFAAPVTGVKHYTINIKEFTDNIGGGGLTRLWGYNPAVPLGGGNQPQKHLGGIIVANKGTPIQITFQNQLIRQGQALRNIIPVDETLIETGSKAQNRTAVHLHGGHIPWYSDGGPFDWWDPFGNHGPSFLNNLILNPRALPNQAEYFYTMDQSARLLWYHEHAYGITRINAYAGVASAMVVRDEFEANLVLPANPPLKPYGGLPEYIETTVLWNAAHPTQKRPIVELPIVIQDKVFVNGSSNNGTLVTDPTWANVARADVQGQGSLWYAHVYEPTRWRLLTGGKFLPPPNPSVVPEFFGDTMLTNGTVYPKVDLEARPYRLRLLNACNARFLNLQLYLKDASPSGITLGANSNPTNDPFIWLGPQPVVGGNPATQNVAGQSKCLVIGNEGGFLAKPVAMPLNVPFNPVTLKGSLLMAPAERLDVIIDFRGYEGKEFILYTDAPAPFPVGDDRYDQLPNTTQAVGPNTREILRIIVGPAMTAITPVQLPPNFQNQPAVNLDAWNDTLIFPNYLPTGFPNETQPTPGLTFKPTRKLTLNETFDKYGRLTQMLGTTVLQPGGTYGQPYLKTPATETVKAGTTEIWEIYNATGDTHPIHFHLSTVQVLSRQPFVVKFGQFTKMGTPTPPGADEVGWKDTVRMNPGEVTRVAITFTLPPNPPGVSPTKGNNYLLSPRTGGNEYVWHCHILEHEEHDMMRPLVVMP